MQHCWLSATTTMTTISPLDRGFVRLMIRDGRRSGRGLGTRRSLSVASRVGLKIHDHNGHVITSNTLCRTRVLADNIIEHLGSDLSRRQVVNTRQHILHGPFISEAIPNAVATQQNKLIRWFQLQPLHIF